MGTFHTVYPTKSVIKYLGVKIDINLSWQYHVNDFSIKLNINYETITMKP